MILGYFPMHTPEKMTPILEHLQKLFPHEDDRLPDFLVYDRACRVWPAMHNKGGELEDFCERWGYLRWIIDRFHFFSHSRKEPYCR